MKLVRYCEAGAERPGMIDPEGRLCDLSARTVDLSGKVLDPNALAALSAVDPASLPLVDAPPRHGPCVAGTGKFICIGLNYSDHAAETGARVPPEPIIFMKATSAICGSNDDIMLPSGSIKTDWEWNSVLSLGRPPNISRRKARSITSPDTAWCTTYPNAPFKSSIRVSGRKASRPTPWDRSVLGW